LSEGGKVRARAAKSPKIGRVVFWFVLNLIGLFWRPAMAADDPAPVRNTFGSVGIVDMPSARMATDGALSLSTDFFQNNQRYALGFQIFPWLEGSFRYAGLQHFSVDYPVYYDRSFALKARLWEESDTIPSLAVGVNDLVGTGVYGGEYFVASKRFGAFDASVGMGWGRLASDKTFKNPLSVLSKSFDTRGTGAKQGGTFNFSQYFHGPTAGIFGGISWRTPVNGLVLSAEYSSDTYDAEQMRGNFAPKNQLNFGASYELTHGVLLNLDWLYGRSIGGGITFQLDPRAESYPQKVNTAHLPIPTLRTAEQQQAALLSVRKLRDAPIPAKYSASDQTEMVDRLWRQPGVSDIEIQGRSLILTSVRSASGPTCLDAARIIQEYQSDISSVTLRPETGRPLRCATASAPDRDFVHGIFVGGLNASPAKQGVQPAVLVIDATAPPRPSAKAVIAAIKAQARIQSISIEAVQLTESEVVIYYMNSHYFSELNALTRLAEVLMKTTPSSVERFRLISLTNSLPNREFDILRAPLEREYEANNRLNLLANDREVVASPAPEYNPILSAAVRPFPRFNWSIYPQFRQAFFDPANPFGIQFVGAASATLELLRGWTLNGEAEASIYDNFYTSRTSDSNLPHVRTDFVKYFTAGKNGLGTLDSEYRFRFTPEISAVAKIGYLESMFFGGGGEILWRPNNQRWALGIDAYRVRQRSFNRLFGLRDYQAFTGHLSLYYAMPWYDLNLTLRAGQYLAGDRGLTVEITRRFSTGVEIGFFATKTNVSAAQFGEGSFDKGLIIRIPIGWALPVETQNQFNVDLRPIQRDGGQRLMNDAILYDETRRSSQTEMQNQLR
jgi:hypothetical protein